MCTELHRSPANLKIPVYVLYLIIVEYGLGFAYARERILATKRN
jgi:hypothetical protein